MLIGKREVAFAVVTFFFLDNDDVILATEQLLEIKTPDKERLDHIRYRC